MQTERVEFFSEGARLRGLLRLPDEPPAEPQRPSSRARAGLGWPRPRPTCPGTKA